MKLVLIAVKEGVTNFGNGTLFLVEDTLVTNEYEGSIRKYYQIPDDGMGRPTLVEAKNIVLCDNDALRKAEAGHGRCNFTKEEIINAGNEKYEEDFSVRTISFQQLDHEWFLIWRLPKINQSTNACSFLNKVTKEKTTIEATSIELEYEVFSIDPVNYEQTSRKFTGMHNRWDLRSLPPGFYEAHSKLSNTSTGIVHFIKHYPIQLPGKDSRETTEVLAIPFSTERWNAALDIQLAWGPESRIPFQVRLLDLYPEMKWAEANYLEKICNEAASVAWKVYEKEADHLISLHEAMQEVAASFPWIDEKRQSRLRSQGEYYSKLNG